MPISGKKMLKLYYDAGWKFLRQKGSHVHVGKDGQVQTIVMEKELSKGLEHQLRKTLKGSRK